MCVTHIPVATNQSDVDKSFNVFTNGYYEYIR